MILYRKVRIGLYGSTTIRHNHWRRKPTGGYTIVKTHQMRVKKVDYRKYLIQTPPPVFVKQPRPSTDNFFRNIEDDTSEAIVNKSFDISSSIFPQYAPLIEAGRLLYNRKEEISNALKITFSNQSLDTKVDGLAKLVTEIAVMEIKQNAASKGSEHLTNIMDSYGVFSKLNEKFGLTSTNSEQEIFKGFFRFTAENLIMGSL